MTRVHDRIPYAVKVRFRTASSFLVAYSFNLSKGGMFIETDAVPPLGARLMLRFDIPGNGLLELAGTVTWRREVRDPTGAPPGAGVAFQEVDQICGEAIDRMVAHFQGVTILLVSAVARDRTALRRLARSVIGAAFIIEAGTLNATGQHLESAVDTVVVNFDGSPGLAAAAIELAAGAGVPVVAIASSPIERKQARELGAVETVPAPAQLGALQTAILSALGRPIAIDVDDD